MLRFRIQPGASIGDAVALGADLRNPMRPTRAVTPMVPIVTSSDPAVVVQTVKLAEDGSGGLIVVRLYESRSSRRHHHPDVRWDRGGDRLRRLLLERPLPGTPTSEGSSIMLPFRPFQLRTVRFHGATAR